MEGDEDEGAVLDSTVDAVIGEGRGEADRTTPGVEFLAPDEGSFAKAIKELAESEEFVGGKGDAIWRVNVVDVVIEDAVEESGLYESPSGRR
jgi:hypothetical protein